MQRAFQALVEHVLERPSKITYRGRADHAPAALQRMKGAPDDCKAVAIIGLHAPARHAALEFGLYLGRLFQKDVPEFRLDIISACRRNRLLRLRLGDRLIAVGHLVQRFFEAIEVRHHTGGIGDIAAVGTAQCLQVPFLRRHHIGKRVAQRRIAYQARTRLRQRQAQACKAVRAFWLADDGEPGGDFVQQAIASRQLIVVAGLQARLEQLLDTRHVDQ